MEKISLAVREPGLDDGDDVDDYENLSGSMPPPGVPTREKKGQEQHRNSDLALTRLGLPTKAPQAACPVSQTVVNTQESSSFQPPALGLDFSSPAVNAAFRNEEGFQNNDKQNRNGKLMPILAFVVISVLLSLSVLLGVLFMHYTTISAELTGIKLNGSIIIDQIVQLRENVANFQKAEDKERNDLKIELTANTDTLEKLCKTCPRGWRASGNNCYYFSSTLMTWDEARSECNKFNSDLVTMSNRSEMNEFNKLFQGSTKYWIGLRRDKVNIHIWKWVDETEAKDTNWAVNEPNYYGKSEHCGETLSGPWNDRDCNNKLNFICKKVWVC
uniref:C-type lectin domain-containing protein n=1 Tax=Leptobrachium leishanense TaxID=445787 RepID=A0A8C5QEQ6_9ANUR